MDVYSVRQRNSFYNRQSPTPLIWDSKCSNWAVEGWKRSYFYDETHFSAKFVRISPGFSESDHRIWEGTGLEYSRSEHLECFHFKAGTVLADLFCAEWRNLGPPNLGGNRIKIFKIRTS
ncbi:hypothetical protein QE152_g22903 [Popillia japonica]|uniref:Uncharacterized protein n=1 Tax=Popillia japonica TaxID=7064 RepID=A0AAW1KH86_POPJA